MTLTDLSLEMINFKGSFLKGYVDTIFFIKILFKNLTRSWFVSSIASGNAHGLTITPWIVISRS